MRLLLTFLILLSGIINSHALPPHIATFEYISDSTKNKESLLQRIYRYFDDSNETKEEKHLDISFIGGPHYSNETKFGIGLIASGLYRLDKNDLTLSPSNVSLYGDFSSSGFYMLGISGNTIFPKNKYRLDTDFFFFSMPSRFWGVGYRSGRYNHYTKYTENDIALKVNFLINLEHHTYIGFSGHIHDIRRVHSKDNSRYPENKRHHTAIGNGIMLAYDSRDFIPNPYSGMYLMAEQMFFSQYLGSTTNFNRTNLTARFYQSAWKGAVIAYEISGVFNNGNVPWTMMAQLGSSYNMRGYYRGQYRDKKMLQTQLELRQKVYGRSGIAVWGGAGNIFPYFDDIKWSETLPNWGIGYRWEFKNRVNIRLDFGMGKNGQSGFYFNINEAF